MIPKSEARNLLYKTIAHLKTIEEAIDSIDSLIGINYEMPFPDAILRLIEQHVSVVARCISEANADDIDEMISWYIWDNRFGENELQATPNDFYQKKPIKSVDDLIWLIYSE